MLKDHKLDKIFTALTRSSKIHNLTTYIENTAGDASWHKGYGGKNIDSPMAMASITKLFITTCVAQLVQSGEIHLDDPITKYLKAEVVDGLHVYKGVDYSTSLTLGDLLFQISGLPDYFFGGREPFDTAIKKQDRFIPFDEMLAIAKSMKKQFAPRKPGRAFYADINFDLLGIILENIYGTPLSGIYREKIFRPLGLGSTYVVTSEQDKVPDVYHHHRIIKVTKFLMSCPASGGGITTARELMVFIKAFWGGELFDKSILPMLDDPKRLQMTYGPIRYAGGYMHIHAAMPLQKGVTLVGHSGSTGSFSFYCPQKELFFVGDTNQASSPAIPISFLMRLALAAR